jgi:hypothetical protein
MRFAAYITIFCLLALGSCKKNNTGTDTAIGNTPVKMAYADSVFFLKSADYTVAPSTPRTGDYTAFPDDLNIDNNTGVITISEKGKENKESQTGLKYKINFNGHNGEKDSTFIIIGGINYQDRIYNLKDSDFIVKPIYNGDVLKQVPSGTYGISSNNKLKINPANGEIDLKESVRLGLFQDDPQNDRWRQVTIKYQSNDRSAGQRNSLDVIVYYYNTVADIPSNVSAAMRSHQSLLVGVNPVTIPVTNAPVDESIKNIVSLGKPRPPCIIIVGH